MPCERPGVIPIDESCCFSCFMEGRSTYDAPIAIVLHEVDLHIEALNNKLEVCCVTEHDQCHQSFHYGVGADGEIINWVDPDNTAWAFAPDNSHPSCGTCGWSIATQEGTNVNPNLYTINIAVSGGISAIAGGGQSLSENAYSDRQYNSLVRLVGWLADTYGISVNQNSVWRHCDELDDFPGVCDDCFTYSKFLESIQECIDSPDYSCDYQCGCLQNAEPTTPTGCDLGSWFGQGCQEENCDCDCDECVCGCAEVTSIDFCTSEDPATMIVTGLGFETCVVDGRQGIKVRISDKEPTNTVVLEFPQPQNNLRLCFDSLGGNDVLNFTLTPTSGPDAEGCYTWTGPVDAISFTYSFGVTIPDDTEEYVCLNQMQSDECYCDQPAPLMPGMTIQGCDCKCYTFQDVAGQVDYCSLMQGAVPAATTDAVPGQTMLLSRDCNSYFFPTLCGQILDLVPTSMPQNFLLFGREGNDCVTTSVNPSCDPAEFTNAVLGLSQDETTIGFYRPRPSLPTRTAVNGESLVPATDGVVYLDAENGPQIFNLVAPGPCDPTEYWIKRKDCNQVNTVTVNGGANTIDTLPAIQLGTPGPYGGCGESVHLHWDGVNWSIL